MNKNNIKRITAVIAALCMAFTSIPTWAATQTDPTMIDYDQRVQANWEDYIKTVGKAALAYQTSPIDISGLRLSTSKIGDFQQAVLANYPELFYWKKLQYYTNGSYVTSIIPIYSYDKDTSMSMLDEFYNEADKYLALVNDDMSNFEKALVLHDALVSDVAYEYPDVANKQTYSFMIEKIGYCDLYSKVYAYLLSQCGIRSEIIFSDSMNHQWLKAELIPGRYFNIDITWNDPTPNINGQVFHTFYALSDTALKNDGKHSDYDTIYPDDSYFDNSGITDLNTAIVGLNGGLYAIDENKKLVRLDIQLGENSGTLKKTTVAELKNMRWSAGGYSYWIGIFTALFKHGDKLYYNTPDSICWIDPATSETGVLVTPEKPSGKSIYGCYIKDGIAYAVYKSSPNDSSGTIYTAVYDFGDEPYTSPSHEHSYGDPSWTWSDDMTSATATFRCKDCTENHTVEASIESYSDSFGNTHYTASVEFGRKVYKTSKTVYLCSLILPESMEVVSSDKPAVNGKYYEGTKVTIRVRDEYEVTKISFINISNYEWTDDNDLVVTISMGDAVIDTDYKIVTTVINGFSVSLGSQLGLNVYFQPEYDIIDDGYIIINGSSGEEKIPLSKLSHDEKYRYRVTYLLPPKDINEKVNISFCYGNGNTTEFSLLNYTPYVRSFDYSPVEYLDKLSENSNEKLAALADALKVYGNNAKAFFDGTTSAETVTGLTSYDVRDFASSVSNGNKTTYYGQSLLLRSETALRLYYKGDVSSCTVKDNSNRNVEFVTGTAQGMNYVEIPNITANKLETKYTVTQADGGKVTVSPMTYVYETLLRYEKDSTYSQLCSTVRALYNYEKAVQQYIRS